jgi:beta-glucanase (GH16 family)
MFCALSCKDHESHLVWSDEFAQNGAPDSTKWSYDLGDGCPDVCGWGNNELEYYTNDPANVKIEDGHLIIQANQDSTGGKPYSSSRLVSRYKGDWVYGRIEVRAKLPGGTGTWPAIWLMPTDSKYGNWPNSGEIDMMEQVGFDPETIHGTLHSQLYNSLKGTQKTGQVTVPDCVDQFHVYAITWSADRIDFFVDDQNYESVSRDPADGIPGWPFDQRFYLILNLAVGGNWGGQKGVDPSIWPRRMEVDYVRVYQ